MNEASENTLKLLAKLEAAKLLEVSSIAEAQEDYHTEWSTIYNVVVDRSRQLLSSVLAKQVALPEILVQTTRWRLGALLLTMALERWWTSWTVRGCLRLWVPRWELLVRQIHTYVRFIRVDLTGVLAAVPPLGDSLRTT
jgi:hypothetical protein